MTNQSSRTDPGSCERSGGRVQRLRRQLGHALGRLRDTQPRTRHDPITIGPLLNPAPAAPADTSTTPSTTRISWSECRIGERLKITIESTFATVRLRTKVTKGPGSRAAGLAMAYKLIEAAQTRWRAVSRFGHVGLADPGGWY